MILSENLLSSTQSSLTPDIIQRFSLALGQPKEKIQMGLRTVIPTLLMGIINKAKTQEGAASLVTLAKEESFSLEHPEVIDSDQSYLSKGSDAVRSIFGNNLSTVVSKLGVTTGMNPTSLTKMLGMAAPMVMSVLGSKIKQDQMTPSSLMGFLSNQNVNLSGYIPSTLTNAFSAGGKTITSESLRSRQMPWGWLLLSALAFFGAILWLTGREI